MTEAPEHIAKELAAVARDLRDLAREQPRLAEWLRRRARRLEITAMGGDPGLVPIGDGAGSAERNG